MVLFSLIVYYHNSMIKVKTTHSSRKAVSEVLLLRQTAIALQCCEMVQQDFSEISNVSAMTKTDF